MTKIRKGQAPPELSRIQFHDRFSQSFKDPLFAPEDATLARIEDVAWEAYRDSRKAPVTQKAGKGYADPGYELSVEWAGTRARLHRADAKRKKAATRSRVLLVIGSARNDGTCPGEISKTFRLAGVAKKMFEAARFDVDTLDLSLLTSEYGRRIYPCKGCVSTAMPLCHWPCSCYPNHALGQTGDWMAEIYERWTAAHGVVILTAVYWYQVPSTLKLMINRLVCADGGNPDPTSTSGKNAAKAKALELEGWPYPKPSPVASTDWWSTVTSPESKACGARFRIGSTGWAWSMPDRKRGSIATSATTSRMRPVMTPSIGTRMFRKKCGTSRVRSSPRCARRVPASSPRGTRN